MGAAGFEETRKAAQDRSAPLSPAGPAAQDGPEPLAVAGSVAALVAALARAAAAAADAGDLSRARALLEDALRAERPVQPPALELVACRGTP